MTTAREPDLPMRDRILYSLVLYAGVMGTYFAAGSIARPPLVSVATPLDDAIPFVPEAMVGYALAYVVPLALLFVETTEHGIRRMMRAAFLAYLAAAPFFVVMPVRDADPPLQPTNALQRMLVANRDADKSKNAFPSMHVGLATLLALIGSRRSRAWAWGLGACALLICASTLLVKQHFLVDLPAGALIAWMAYRVVYGRDDASQEALA
jgi:membrane-associated phospholipid phosphatase